MENHLPPKTEKPLNTSHPALKPTTTPGANLVRLAGGACRLEIPLGPKGRYRLAQLDDYSRLSRERFPWQPPATLNLEARVSSAAIPGTWGFGLWNDPFSLSMGFGGGERRLPALPNAAWFFFASPQNYLSFRDDLPAQGFMAQTFRSRSLPAPLLAFSLLGAPALAWPWLARKVRPMFKHFIREAALAPQKDVCQWHTYCLEWKFEAVTFRINGEKVFKTAISPLGRLGLILWIDNQYAAFPPDGKLSYGKLESPETAWLEIKSISLTAS